MQTRRMFAHDYTRVGFYMITIVTARRRPLFGICRDNRVELSPTGETVKRCWHEIPQHRPAIETSTLMVMPDHLHGILYVEEMLPKPIGDIIRGFKSGVTSELRRSFADPGLEIWQDSFHDRIIMNSDTLREERCYIEDNPRRYCMRKANPDLFSRVTHLDSSRLPTGRDWSGFGNLFLLDKPDWMPVQVSRSATSQQISDLKEETLGRISRGTVMVSPFISPGEKAIAATVMEQDYGSLVLLKPDGFPPLYKPSRAYFDLCAQGRLLVLSPFAYTGRRQALTRECCLQMNAYVQQLCGKTLRQ